MSTKTKDNGKVTGLDCLAMLSWMEGIGDLKVRTEIERVNTLKGPCVSITCHAWENKPASQAPMLLASANVSAAAWKDGDIHAALLSCLYTLDTNLELARGDLNGPTM